METVNITFDITPSTTPMRFSLGVAPLKNEAAQPEVPAVAAKEEQTPATGEVRIAEPEVHLPAEVTAFPFSGNESGASQTGGMIPGYEN